MFVVRIKMARPRGIVHPDRAFDVAKLLAFSISIVVYGSIWRCSCYPVSGRLWPLPPGDRDHDSRLAVVWIADTLQSFYFDAANWSTDWIQRCPIRLHARPKTLSFEIARPRIRHTVAKRTSSAVVLLCLKQLLNASSSMFDHHGADSSGHGTLIDRNMVRNSQCMRSGKQ